jgi:dTDP-4-dehydrorhamnose 3,5-epimerase
LANIHLSEVISDVVVVEPAIHADTRGRFIESYRRSWFPLGREMVQGNRSDRDAGAVVGLHYHLHQADYWFITKGRAQVVLHDLRLGSPTEGATLMIEIGDANEQGIFIPPGVAHGFSSLTELTLTYLVDSYYNPKDELGVAWNDPEIGADWMIAQPVISDRDLANPKKGDIADHLLPRFGLRT